MAKKITKVKSKDDKRLDKIEELQDQLEEELEAEMAADRIRGSGCHHFLPGAGHGAAVRDDGCDPVLDYRDFPAGPDPGHHPDRGDSKKATGRKGAGVNHG